MKKMLSLALCAAMLAVFTGCTSAAPEPSAVPSAEPAASAAPSADPSQEPDAEPSASPDAQPDAADPSQEPDGGLTEQASDYGYTLCFDPALFTFANAEGVDKYAFTADPAAGTLKVYPLPQDQIESFESEHMAEGKSAVTLGTGDYAANTATIVESAADGETTITRDVYTVALSDGSALVLEVERTSDSQMVALQSMLDSFTLA